MSLRQLAGPFLLTDDQGNPLGPHTIYPILYYPKVGLIMKIDYARAALTLVTYDGIGQALNTYDVGGAGGFNPAHWRYDVYRDLMITNGGQREKVCLCESDYTHGFGAGPFAFSGIITADREIWVSSGELDNNTGIEKVFPGGVDMTAGNMGPGRTPTEVYAGGVTDSSHANWAIFYDTLARKFTSPGMHLPDGVVTSYWDSDSSVLVTITDAPYALTIYSLDVIPASLSAITLKSGVQAKGATAVFKVQVLGDRSDWSVGVLVDWSITSGDGVLLDTQSKTGDDGFAVCRVFYPTTASVSTVLEASVTC